MPTGRHSTLSSPRHATNKRSNGGDGSTPFWTLRMTSFRGKKRRLFPDQNIVQGHIRWLSYWRILARNDSGLEAGNRKRSLGRRELSIRARPVEARSARSLG